MAGLKLKLLGVHIAAMLLLLLLMSGTCSRAHLVEDIPLVLSYHDGPLLTSSSALDLNLIWYGKFSPVQRSIVGDFVQSLGASSNGNVQPSVSAWWKTTQGYKDTSNAAGAVAVAPRLGIQKLDEAYSLGKALKRSDVAALVEGAVQSGGPPENISNAIYLVLTSADVSVERFCMSSCGFHGGLEYGSRAVPYAWVGNAESQCPGQCAWPFHQPLYGPQTPPLLSPNADVGVDGMIINIAAVLAGAVTNPFNTGFFQGDAAAPLEAVSACAGIYGKGAYPGFPGQLPVDSITGASYNADGVNGRKFLLPAMWDPVSRSCRTRP